MFLDQVKTLFIPRWSRNYSDGLRACPKKLRYAASSCEKASKRVCKCVFVIVTGVNISSFNHHLLLQHALIRKI